MQASAMSNGNGNFLWQQPDFYAIIFLVEASGRYDYAYIVA